MRRARSAFEVRRAMFNVRCCPVPYENLVPGQAFGLSEKSHRWESDETFDAGVVGAPRDIAFQAGRGAGRISRGDPAVCRPGAVGLQPAAVAVYRRARKKESRTVAEGGVQPTKDQ